MLVMCYYVIVSALSHYKRNDMTSFLGGYVYVVMWLVWTKSYDNKTMLK